MKKQGKAFHLQTKILQIHGFFNGYGHRHRSPHHWVVAHADKSHHYFNFVFSEQPGNDNSCPGGSETQNQVQNDVVERRQ